MSTLRVAGIQLTTTVGSVTDVAGTYTYMSFDGTGNVTIPNVLRASNRIGIKNTNPTYDLDITGTFNVTGNSRIASVVEQLETRASGQSGAQTYNFNNAAIFYHPSIAGTLSAQFTNIPTDQNKAYAISVVVIQGSTPFGFSNTVTINGTNSTIRWSGGSSPQLTANRTDIFNFSIINTNGTYIVLAGKSDFA
jgi:hypothetical protein